MRLESFELQLGDVGVFGGRRRPRVVWIGLAAGAEPLGRLAALVEEACRRAGLPAEERPFRAHLTLARAADRLPSELPPPPPPPALPPWPVAAMTLYRSRLGRGPAVYEPLERYGFVQPR